MTVAELSSRLTSAEEAHWLALYRRMPWGTAALDAMNAMRAQLTYNVNAAKGKSKKLDDFLMFTDKPSKKGDTPDQIRQNFERLMARQG